MKFGFVWPSVYEKTFEEFSLYESIKTSDPWPQGYNLNNLTIGPQDKATHQISKALVFYFQTRRIFKFCL